MNFLLRWRYRKVIAVVLSNAVHWVGKKEAENQIAEWKTKLKAWVQKQKWLGGDIRRIVCAEIDRLDYDDIIKLVEKVASA
jgi:hypothetical protein